MKVLVETILKNILLENRVKDVKKKYPQLADGTGEYPIIDYFVANDPSGNNKYLEWMVKAMLHKPTTETIMQEIGDYSWREGVWGDVAGFIVDLVKRFHNLLPYLVHKDNEGKEEGTTDLYQYKFTDSEMINYLVFDIERATERKNAKEKIKDARKNSDKIYESDKWLIVRPKTWEASCVYGAGTKWCTTNKTSSSHFDRETDRNFLIYVINKNKNEKDRFYKVAWQLKYKKDYNDIIRDDGTIDPRNINLWDAEDRNFVKSSEDYIEEIPLDVKLRIRSYMNNSINAIYEKKGFHEDPRLQAIIEIYNLTQEDIDSVIIRNNRYYSMPIYIVENNESVFAVGNEDEVEATKNEWAESYVNDVGPREVVNNMANPGKYLYINDANYIASDDADYRIGEMSDDEVLEEASRSDNKRLESLVEEQSINLSIFEDNESTIEDMQERYDELTDDEKEELKEIEKEYEELKVDLENNFKRIRELLREEYYEEILYRLENNTLDWLWEMGYYDKRTNTIELSAYKNNLVGIDEEELVSDVADEVELETISEDGEWEEVTIEGDYYYVFKLDYEYYG